MERRDLGGLPVFFQAYSAGSWRDSSLLADIKPHERRREIASELFDGAG